MPPIIDIIIDTINATKLNVPAIEPFLLIIILTLAIFFRFPRFGLLAGYIFTFRWCWPLAKTLQLEAQIAYVFFGVLVGLLAVVGMLQEKSDY